MPSQSWMAACPPFGDTLGAAFNTFTTFKDVSPVPLPVVFGWQVEPGTMVQLEAEGEFSCATGVTLSIGFIWGATPGATGGVILAQSAAITTGTSPTAWPWHCKYRGVVTAVGATGTIVGSGVLDLGTSLTAYSSNALPTTQALRTVTIDTSVAKQIGVGAAWGASAAGNSIKVNNLSAALLN